MTDELEQMSPNQRRALNKALSALEAFAAIWAAEIRLGAMSARIAAVPNEAERAKRIEAMIEQGFVEGAYRHYLDHKDKCDELEATRATAEQPDAKPSTEQDWVKLDGAVAFHLIERHAEDWADAGAMMDAWRKAKSQQDAAIKSTEKTS